MEKSIPARQMAGFLTTSILGTFLHFLFELTGENAAVALFSAVNESIWEHMKLIYYPMLLVALVQYRRFGKETDDFWCIKLRGILLALILILLIGGLFTVFTFWPPRVPLLRDPVTGTYGFQKIR